MAAHVSRRTNLFPVIALLFQFQLLSAQTPSPRTDRSPVGPDRPQMSSISLTPQCDAARSRSEALLAELETSVPASTRTSIEQAAARPGPGVSKAKALGDTAAAYMLVGDLSTAAWAGLKAALAEWKGETVANAGVYLFHLGKNDDALQLLTCSYGAGFRSPYLLEALAVVNHARGGTGEARRYIGEAAQADPNDAIIETEASFINNGGPPPARPPQPERDAMDEAIAELEEHAGRAINLIRLQGDLIDRSIPDAKARDFAKISIDYISTLVPMLREQARAARSQPPASQQTIVNAVLSMAIANYAQISDQILSFATTSQTNGSPLLFWSDVLGLDPPVLHREQEGGWTEAIRWSMHGMGDALSQPPLTEFTKNKDAGYKEFVRRERACDDDPCRVRENARWCAIRRELFRSWEAASRQRHNAAARRFDQVATRRIIAAENEYLQIRDYAVRQLRKMKFPAPVQGVSMQQITIDGINATIKPIYDKHLSTEDGSSGTVNFLRERARWFEAERASLDEALRLEADDIKTTCEPAMRALLELLAQEEWQAYLDHLRDRLSWSVQPQTESSFPCEGSIGPLTIETDLNKPGEGKMDLKWKGKSFSAGGNVVFGPGGTSVGVGGSVKTQGVTLSGGADASGNAGIGAGGGYGPFQGKTKVSLTSKRNPWGGGDYLGIKIKGSAGLGLSSRSGRFGVKCFPSSGSITIYPRAFYEEAVRYLSTPSSPPARRGR